MIKKGNYLDKHCLLSSTNSITILAMTTSDNNIYCYYYFGGVLSSHRFIVYIDW